MKNKTIKSILIYSIIMMTKCHSSSLTNNKEISNYRYILGPGDSISVNLIKLEGFNNKVNILPDGTINLPRVGIIYISGMSISEATNTIQEKYKSILKTPIVYLNLVKARPIRISVLGEVQRPGIYSLSQFENNNLSNSDGGESFEVSSKGWPSVIDGLQKAGGVTPKANLKKISLIRSSKSSKSSKSIDINYWNVFNENVKVFNPLIYDGDIIKVHKVVSIENENLLKISKSNLAPATVSINVIGEVKNPGTINVRSGAPLSEGIFAAGGLSRQGNKHRVSLFRLNDNGSIYHEKLSFNPKKKLNNSNNPYLQDRDVILVGKNAWAKFNSGLKSTLEPVSPIISAGALYKLFDN